MFYNTMNKLKLAVVVIITIFDFFPMTYAWSGYIHHYEIEYTNQSLVNMSAFVRKINRTAYAGNIIFDLKEDFPTDNEVELKIYGEYTNKYRELPINIKRSICSMINMEYQLVKNEVIGEIPEKCPIKKGHYYIKDFVLNLSQIPKNPWSNIRNFKFTMKFFNARLNILVAILTVYIRTTLDDEYEK